MGSDPGSASSTFHIESHGDAGAPALLCIHGLGGGAYFFSALGEALKLSARTLAFDLPGHGFSPRDPQGFSFDRCADRVVELARAQSKPITLLGHSLGTIVALKAYASAPELFDRLIFVGGLPQPTIESQAALREVAKMIAARGSLVGMGASMLPHLISPATLQTMPGLLGAIERLIELNTAANYAETCVALAHANAADVVKSVRVPCCLITGRDDRYAPPAAVRAFASELPGTPPVHELADCGHFPFFEKPREFAAIVRAFVPSQNKKPEA